MGTGQAANPELRLLGKVEPQELATTDISLRPAELILNKTL